MRPARAPAPRFARSARAAGAALAACLAACPAACTDSEPRPASQGSVLEGPWTFLAMEDAAGNPVETPAWAAALPADTLSVTLMATGQSDERLGIGVRGADGRELADPGRPISSPSRTLPARGVAVGTIPAGSAALPIETAYRVRAVRLPPAAGTDGRAPLSMSVWVKRTGTGSPAVPDTQELPLVLCFLGAAPDAARTDAALAEVRRIWRAAGIEVVETGRILLDDQVARSLARIEIDPAEGSDTPALGAALRLSDRAPAPGLPLFVAAGVSLAGGDPLWALSGSIPVPPLRGTRRSGIVVDRGLIERDPGRAGVVIAHEIGHALGLFHTTEGKLLALNAPIPSAVHDPLDDTPECPSEADRAPADGLLAAEECGAHDAQNLMFWATGRAATRLTPGQGALARRSALVR